MQKREQQFQTEFNKWVKNCFPFTAAYELKAAEANSIPFSAVADHQERALDVANNGPRPFVYKISDFDRMQKPFDCFSLFGVPAYVVIIFNWNQGNRKDFVMIEIDDWLEEAESSERKSITSERADQIGRRFTLGTCNVRD